MTRPVVLLSLVALAAVGCDNAPPPPDLHPLTGTITRDGKPVTAGGLIFVPAGGGSGGVTVDASVKPDGTFEARTSRWNGKETVFRPGVKPGRYKATYHPPGDGQALGLEVELATEVVVEAKANTATFELPTKMPAGNGSPRDDANPPESPPKAKSAP